MPVCKRRPAVDIEIADRQIFCRRRKIFPVFAGPEPSASELFQELEHGEHCRAWIVSGGIDDIPFCLECKNICILFFIKSEEYGFLCNRRICFGSPDHQFIRRFAVTDLRSGNSFYDTLEFIDCCLFRQCCPGFQFNPGNAVCHNVQSGKRKYHAPRKETRQKFFDHNNSFF